jgi:effector-binding domain-containing protein
MSSQPQDPTGTATPEFTISPMRVQTMRGGPFFYLSTPTTMPELGQAIASTMPKLMAAQRAGNVTMAGPMVFIYTGEYENGPFLLEMGFPVPEGTQPAGEAQVRRLSDFHCASVVYCGALRHMSQAYGELGVKMQQAGLQMGNEMREWYLYFEDDQSPNNVTLIQHGLR